MNAANSCKRPVNRTTIIANQIVVQLLIQKLQKHPKFVKKMGLGETRDVVVSTFIVAAAAVIGLEWWNRRQQVNSLLSISSICISFWR